MRIVQHLARLALAAFMLFAGLGHFRATQTFLAQVPPFLPWRELIVQVSGVMEIVLALGLLLPQPHRARAGLALAAFYILIFPGNLSQYFTHTPAFGLDSDAARAVRLLFQPVLVAWALWCTGAYAHWRTRRALASSRS